MSQYFVIDSFQPNHTTNYANWSVVSQSIYYEKNAR